MSSIFDTAVYNLRNSCPFALPQPMKFIEEKTRDGNRPVTLCCWPRPSVASRLWWEITWTEANGETYHASAQEWPLAFWRAIQTHKQNQRRAELESQGVTAGPSKTQLSYARVYGWEDGDGI